MGMSGVFGSSAQRVFCLRTGRPLEGGGIWR
jgi:hypothetical protein